MGIAATEAIITTAIMVAIAITAVGTAIIAAIVITAADTATTAGTSAALQVVLVLAAEL